MTKRSNARKAAAALTSERTWRQRAEAAEAALDRLHADMRDVAADMKRQSEVRVQRACAQMQGLTARASCGRLVQKGLNGTFSAPAPKQGVREQLERRVEEFSAQEAALRAQLARGDATIAELRDALHAAGEAAQQQGLLQEQRMAEARNEFGATLKAALSRVEQRLEERHTLGG